MLRLSAEVRLLARFATTGVINTLVGASVILVLDLGVRLHPVVANVCGYSVGLLLSWVLHRRFVFRTTERGWLTGARYMAAFAAAFAANMAALRLSNSVLGDSDAARAAAQLIAVGAYTSVQFAFLRLWVFRSRAAPTMGEGGP